MSQLKTPFLIIIFCLLYGHLGYITAARMILSRYLRVPSPTEPRGGVDPQVFGQVGLHIGLE
jgi:hypothetical protein